MSQCGCPKHGQACPHSYTPCKILSLQLYAERACVDSQHGRHTAHICEVYPLHLHSAASAEGTSLHAVTVHTPVLSDANTPILHADNVINTISRQSSLS